MIDKTLPPSVKYLITNTKKYTREVAMTKDEFISSHRLSLLSRAKSINNISRACRDYGVSRTYYYKWVGRYITYGIQGLAERPRPKPVMPNSTRSDVVDKILAFIKKYPTHMVQQELPISWEA